MKNQSVRKSRTLFSWVSAITIGGIFSFLLFVTGADSFDALLINLRIRSAANTELQETYIFGETAISVSFLSVENLSATGIPVTSIFTTTINGRDYFLESKGHIRHPSGIPIPSGMIRMAGVVTKPFDSVREANFCTVTARFNFGIPIYHYDAGVIYSTGNKYELPDSLKSTQSFILAEAEARRIGAPITSEVYISDPTELDFQSQGFTTSQEYCSENHFASFKGKGNVVIITEES